MSYLGDSEQINEIESIVDKFISDACEKIKQTAALADSFAEANGIELGGIGYAGPKEFEVSITTPRAARYLGLIREYDAIVGKYDVLWLSGAIPEKERAATIFAMRRTMLRLVGQIRTISSRARSAVNRKYGENKEQKDDQTEKPDQATTTDEKQKSEQPATLVVVSA